MLADFRVNLQEPELRLGVVKGCIVVGKTRKLGNAEHVRSDDVVIENVELVARIKAVAPAFLRGYQLRLPIFEELILSVLDGVTDIDEVRALKLLILVTVQKYSLHFESFEQVAEVRILVNLLGQGSLEEIEPDGDDVLGVDVGPYYGGNQRQHGEHLANYYTIS